MALCFLFVNSQLAFCDWLYSGLLEHFTGLRIVLSEGQVGWMPFVMQRVDNTWLKGYGDDSHGYRAKTLPSSSVAGHLYGCIFDDLQGLVSRDAIGTEQILIETDFPHSDSTYPHSEKVLSELVRSAGLDDNEIWKVLRGNPIHVYGLDRYFGISS
jgi:hypothetical protein